jgi:hypothetical protein
MRESNHSGKLLILLLLFGLGVSLFSSGAGAQDEGWQIVRAGYGFRDARTDVTDILRDLISRGGVNGRVAVNNQTMGGDPAVGRDKTLHIVARNKRGEQREFDFREGSFIDVGLFAVPRDDWDDRPRNANDRDDRRDDRRDDHPRADRDRDERASLYIIRGYYGVQGRMANVTEQLRSMMREGTLSLNVNNSNLGSDPAPGADKVLIVIYRFQGQEQATAIREGNRLTIP